MTERGCVGAPKRICPTRTLGNEAGYSFGYALFSRRGKLLKEYLKAQSETNRLILSGLSQEEEIERFSKADMRWAKNRKNIYRGKIRKGEVYQFEFGKNYALEMSYEHRGLVLGVRDKLLYVLPIYSYTPEKHKDVYHPVLYPESKSDLFLLKEGEHAFLKHDSVLKLNDLRTVSNGRILYMHEGGYIDPHSEEFKNIERLALLKIFPEFSYKYERMKRELEKA